MALISLSSLKSSVRQRADMVNSQFISDAELTGYINASLAELYDLLVTSYEDYYVSGPFSITTDGTNDAYSLPSDFYKLIGVDVSISPVQDTWISMKRFNFNERNNYNKMIAPSALGYSNVRYRVLGNNIKFTPLPANNTSVRLWYIPSLSYLSSDTDTFNFQNGYEEYVIIDAAIKCMQKEESDVSVLLMQKQAITNRINAAAQNRDVNEPARVTDVRRTEFEGNGWGNGWNNY